MYINGIGIISSVGRGLEAHRGALTSGPLPMTGDGLHRVQEKDLKDPILAKEARRAGRFERMAILAGLDALRDAGIRSDAHPSKVGLILATGLGPHVTTIRFLDDIINFKEKDVSPTLFSHSVHNAAASYLSLLAGIRGPTLTVTRFSFAFYEALNLAHSWLEQKRCEHVLIGAVDELGAVMEQIIRSRSIDAKIALSEGSVFFVLSQAPSERNYGIIAPVQNTATFVLLNNQLLFLETDGLGNSEYKYRDNRMGGSTVLTATLFGHHPCPAALSCATAALLLDDSKLYHAMKPELYLKRSSSLPESCISICRDYKGTTRAIEISRMR